MARKTTIRIETESLLVMRGHDLPRAWCPLCAAESKVIALDSIGVVSNLDQADVDAWLGSEQLHRWASDGAEFICLNSLLTRVQIKKIG